MPSTADDVLAERHRPSLRRAGSRRYGFVLTSGSLDMEATLAGGKYFSHFIRNPLNSRKMRAHRPREICVTYQCTTPPFRARGPCNGRLGSNALMGLVFNFQSVTIRAPRRRSSSVGRATHS